MTHVYVSKTPKLLVAVLVYGCLGFMAASMSVLDDPGQYAREDLNEATFSIYRANEHLEQCKQKALGPPVDCEEHLQRGNWTSGVHTVWPRHRAAQERAVQVFCDMRTDGGGWTVIQRRGDFGKDPDYFYKDWESYKNGFGNILEDFWLGNEDIFSLTNQRQYSVRFDLSDFEGKTAYALYDTFWIEDQDNKYKIHIKDYSGDAGDSMSYHDGWQFSTKDNNNNENNANVNCADSFKGAWWYNYCYTSNLNGLYKRGAFNDSYAQGVTWTTFRGLQYSLRTTEIKIRPKNFRKNRIPVS